MREHAIPQQIHVVWVGDPDLEPINCINTWRTLHPQWQIRVWGNDDWENGDWLNGYHMRAFAKTGQLCGVADLMRWEILLTHGGVAIDADSICLATLPDWLRQCELFASWESEVAAPGLISNGVVGAKPDNSFLSTLVHSLNAKPELATRFSWRKLRRKKVAAWRATGPQMISRLLASTRYANFTLLPSHFFNPIHHSGQTYRGEGPVYCTQVYAGTGGNTYTKLAQMTSEELTAQAKLALGRTND
jgi:mannosyltransferase OCH1-like enzyme